MKVLGRRRRRRRPLPYGVMELFVFSRRRSRHFPLCILEL
jgi:hypothetical protein